MQYQETPPYSGPNLANLQINFLFMRLPIELRRIVYQYVMDDWGWTDRLHIVREYRAGSFGRGRFDTPAPPERTRRLTYVPCTATSEKNPGLSMTACQPTQHPSCRGFNYSSPRFQGFYLSLLLSCRVFHSEATAVLYARHSFDLLDIPSAYRFLTSCSLPALTQIKTLWISAIFPAQQGISTALPSAATYLVSPGVAREIVEQWAAICEVLTQMKGLQKVTLWIYRHVDCGFGEANLLRPLKEVCVEREFAVMMHKKEVEGGPWEVERVLNAV